MSWYRELQPDNNSAKNGVSLDLEVSAVGADREGDCFFCFEEAVCPNNDTDESIQSTNLKFDALGHCLNAIRQRTTYFVVKLSTDNDCLKYCFDESDGSDSDNSDNCCRPEADPPLCTGCIRADLHEFYFDRLGHLFRIKHPCGTVLWQRNRPRQGYNAIRCYVWQISPVDDSDNVSGDSCNNPGAAWDVSKIEMTWDSLGHLVSAVKNGPERFSMPPGGCCTTPPSLTVNFFNYEGISGTECDCGPGFALTIPLRVITCNYGEGAGCYPAYIWEYEGPPIVNQCILNGFPNGEIALLGVIAICDGGLDLSISVNFGNSEGQLLFGVTDLYRRCCNGGPFGGVNIGEGGINQVEWSIPNCDWDWEFIFG